MKKITHEAITYHKGKILTLKVMKILSERIAVVKNAEINNSNIAITRFDFPLMPFIKRTVNIEGTLINSETKKTELNEYISVSSQIRELTLPFNGYLTTVSMITSLDSGSYTLTSSLIIVA